MKRRVLSLFLISILLVGLQLPHSAAALELPVTKNYSGQFSDVPEDAWYASYVAALYELGLSNGQGSPDKFAPESNITIAEVITLAARLKSLYSLGDSEKGAEGYSMQPWFAPYLSYLSGEDSQDPALLDLCTGTATRAETAGILSHALPKELLTEINGEAVTVGYASRSYITDVTDYTPYSQDILMLYRAGIVSGMDRKGSFHPDEPIQRSEIAAMVSRLAKKDLRIRLDWDIELNHSKIGTTLPSLVTSSGAFHPAPDPDDPDMIDADLRYMLSQGKNTIVLQYPKNTLTEETVDKLLHAFLTAVRRYPEQEYNQVNCSYSQRTGLTTVTFSSTMWDENIGPMYRTAALDRAIQIHDELWEQGALTSSMSEYERARVYYTWLCNHCSYDYKSTDSSLSHSGYSALLLGYAVCDGYTSAYNLLLRLEGISCSTVSTDSHIWTVAELDGQTCHIDLTWGDQGEHIAYRYFGMTEADAMARFRT